MISVTERSCTAPISKVEHHILDSYSYYTGYPGGGTRYILGWGGAARPGPSYPDPVKTFVEHTRRLFIVQEEIPCLRQEIDKINSLIKTKNDQIDTLFKTKIPKNIPWLAARPHEALTREYPHPGPDSFYCRHEMISSIERT